MALSSIRSILDETLDRLSLSNLLPHDCSHQSPKKKDLVHEVDLHDRTRASILAILKREVRSSNPNSRRIVQFCISDIHIIATST